MFDNNNFYIFILLFVFSVLLNMFNAYIPHDRWVDIVSWIVLVVPIIAIGYLLKFRNADMKAFYILFSVLLVGYIVIFVTTKIYALFHPAENAVIQMLFFI